jgi:hypothetical protein
MVSQRVYVCDIVIEGQRFSGMNETDYRRITRRQYRSFRPPYKQADHGSASHP